MKKHISVFLILIAISGFLIWRELPAPAPMRISSCNSSIAAPVNSQGVWFWIENPRSLGSRLMKAGETESKPAVVAPGISEFAITDSKLAWIQKTGIVWQLVSSKLDGSEPHVIYSGEREPVGLHYSQKRLYWLLNPLSKKNEFDSFPPLAGSLEVQSVNENGEGKPIALTSLKETQGLQFIGINLIYAFVSVYRPSQYGSTVIYRISVLDSATQRIVGETGKQHAALTKESLFWTAPSPESSTRGTTNCVRYIPVQGAGANSTKPANLTDWLPAGGKLTLSSSGMMYIDGGAEPKLWILNDRKELPVAVKTPLNFDVKAVSGNDILLQNSRTDGSNSALFRTRMP